MRDTQLLGIEIKKAGSFGVASRFLDGLKVLVPVSLEDFTNLWANHVFVGVPDKVVEFTLGVVRLKSLHHLATEHEVDTSYVLYVLVHVNRGEILLICHCLAFRWGGSLPLFLISQY